MTGVQTCALPISKAETLLANNAVLLDKVTVQRRQEGCVRFCYLPLDSDAPRRYRCQPEDAAGASRVRPSFESLRYGDPAFALLTQTCAAEIVTGADDEGEMGAWHFVQAPLRLRNLRIAIDEYLRFGLEAGVFVVAPVAAGGSAGAQTLIPVQPLAVRTRRPARTSRRTT